MTHTVHEKQKLLARMRRIRGLVDAAERAIAEEAGCDKVMHIVAGMRGAISGLMSELVEDHIRTHLLDPSQDHAAAEELIDVLHSYMK